MKDKYHLSIYPELMSDPELYSTEEKLMMCYVRSWKNKTGTALGSPQFFASMLGTTTTKVIQILVSLQARKKITIGFRHDGSRELELGPNWLSSLDAVTTQLTETPKDIFDV